MTKAEMEEAYTKYHTLIKDASLSASVGLHQKAVESALKAWDHIDGMMQYARRYKKQDFESIEAIDLVLRFAPLTFDFESLNQLQSMLQSTKRIERNTSNHLGDKLTEAREAMWRNHQLWTHVEENPECLEHDLPAVLGGARSRWHPVVDAWSTMQLLERTPHEQSYALALSTRMDQMTSAKCGHCGQTDEAPKAMFLEVVECTNCGKSSRFTLLKAISNEEYRA